MSELHISQHWYNLGAQAFFLSPGERQAGIAFITETMAGESDEFILSDAHNALDRLQRVEEAHTAKDAHPSGAQGFAGDMIRLFLQLDANALQPLSDSRLRGMSLAEDFCLEDRIAAAKEDPIAFDVACKFGAIWVNREEVMPSVLKEFVIDVLMQRITRPAEKRGGNPLENLRRNRTIVKAIEVGQHYGLPATRNDASVEVSGCDVVAGQLRDMGLGPSTFAGVKRIWMRRGALNSAFLRTMTGRDA